MLTKQNFDLTEYNSYNIKASCSCAYFPETEDDFQKLFESNPTNKIVIGGGFNIILSKHYYDEDFIILGETFSDVVLTDELIKAQSGVSMYTLSKLALEHSLTGLEIFYDIPSSLGGAVVMNAGAGGEEIKDLLVSVRYFDPFTLQFNEVHRNDISFEYRNSFFQKNPHLIITGVDLILKKGDRDAIQSKMESIKANRWAKQPKDFPNAGSVFKRPPGKFVGPMIENLGLKGFVIGGAKVSEKHAGFIVNYNNASGKDVISLIELIRARVKEAFEVELEVEQRIL